MADQPVEKPDAPAPDTEGQVPSVAESKPEQPELSDREEPKSEEPKEDAAKGADEPNDSTAAEKSEGKSEEKAEEEGEEKPAAEGDTEMPDAAETSTLKADEPAADTADKTPVNQGRRKSAGAGGSNRKSLSKKSSKAKITHLDAKPGDHFLVKLKGFPEWPAVICDESMLPQALLSTRPVTAARPDGTYAEAYADGGKRAHDRNFPVMYLFTNEFGWVVNTALTELTPEMAQKALGGKMRKDLKEAFQLAAEGHTIDYYKGVLKKFEEEMLANQEATKAAADTPKKSKRAKGKSGDGDEDVSMADAGESSKAKTKKRKAEEDANTPQRSDSVKKPKIKLNTSSTPKGTNGATPQSKDASAKSKAKPKKSGDKKEAPKEKLTPEEHRKRKEKEVLYLRHKLQRGLLDKNQPPKEEDMEQMSEFIKTLEKLPKLEVSIIRTTKINKVLKNILKLSSIPHESEFNFKSRSQTILDKWNELMASDGTPVAAGAPANGVNGAAESHAEEKKPEANGEEAEKVEKEPEKEPETELERESEKAPEKAPEGESTAKSGPAEPEKTAESQTEAEGPSREAAAEAAEAAA